MEFSFFASSTRSLIKPDTVLQPTRLLEEDGAIPLYLSRIKKEDLSKWERYRVPINVVCDNSEAGIAENHFFLRSQNNRLYIIKNLHVCHSEGEIVVIIETKEVNESGFPVKISGYHYIFLHFYQSESDSCWIYGGKNEKDIPPPIFFPEKPSCLIASLQRHLS